MQVETQHSAYVLGHTDPELLRLERQGRFLRPLTRDVLLRAGLAPGMRVLDLGAGAGDVSLIAAEIVGPTGEVVGVDRAPEAVERARGRASALGVRNVRFATGDEISAASLAGERGFDAVIGRLVLLHQRDAVATIGRLAALVRPGGLLAFHEIEIEAGFWSSQPLPLMRRAWDWIVGPFTKGGMPTDIGARMTRGFAEAGLVDETVMLEGRVEAGPESGAYEFIARTVGTLLPLAVRLGLASEEEVEIATLEERLREEAVTANARFIPVFFSAAWARVPA